MITIIIAKGVQEEDVRDYINVNKMEDRVASLKERIKEMNRKIIGEIIIDTTSNSRAFSAILSVHCPGNIFKIKNGLQVKFLLNDHPYHSFSGLM